MRIRRRRGADARAIKDAPLGRSIPSSRPLVLVNSAWRTRAYNKHADVNEARLVIYRVLYKSRRYAKTTLGVVTGGALLSARIAAPRCSPFPRDKLAFPKRNDTSNGAILRDVVLIEPPVAASWRRRDDHRLASPITLPRITTVPPSESR